MNFKRKVCMLTVVCCLLSYAFGGEGIGLSSGSGISSGVTPESEKKAEELHQKILDAADLDITYIHSSRSEKFIRDRFSLPHGELHFIKVSKEIQNRKNGKSLYKSNLKMCMLPYEKEITSYMFGNDDDMYQQNAREGYKIIYGEEEYAQLKEKYERKESPWLLYSIFKFYRPAALLESDCPLTENQKKTIKEAESELKQKLQGLEKAYEMCKKEKTQAYIKNVFDLFDGVLDFRSNVFKLGDKLYTREQKLLLAKNRIHNLGSSVETPWKSGSFSFHPKGGGKFICIVEIDSKGAYPIFAPNKKGEYVPADKLENKKEQERIRNSFKKAVDDKLCCASDYLDFFKKGICEVHLGIELKCSLDKNLAQKPVHGKMIFRSIEDGLDKFAKMIGGKLVKNEDGSYRITEK